LEETSLRVARDLKEPMMTRTAALVAVMLTFTGLRAYAGDAGDTTAVVPSSAVVASSPALAAPAPLTAFSTRSIEPRPAMLLGLYASFAALQGYDLYSTTRALGQGAHEANPMMQRAVGNKAVFWTVKAAATIAPMMAAERLWKTNKAGAIAVMVVGNGVMAAVAAHNAQVLHHQQ
jgi:hypothetical protein